MGLLDRILGRTPPETATTSTASPVNRNAGNPGAGNNAQTQQGPAQGGAQPGAGGTLGAPSAGRGIPRVPLEQQDPATLSPEERTRREQRLADRQQVDGELRRQYVVTPENELPPPDQRAPNQVSEAEFRRLCGTYSDIRLNEGNVQLSQTMSAEDPAEQQRRRQAALTDLQSMMQTASGRTVLNTLAEDHVDPATGRPHQTMIGALPSMNPMGANAITMSGPADGSHAHVDGRGNPGPGTSSATSYAPGVDLTTGPVPMRSDVSLFHELSHSMRHVTGTGIGSRGNVPENELVPEDRGQQVPREEYATVGIGNVVHERNGEEVTENAYRAERRRLAGTNANRAGDEAPIMDQRRMYTVPRPA